MKIYCTLLVLVGAIFLSGCEKKTETTTPPATTNAAPADTNAPAH